MSSYTQAVYNKLNGSAAFLALLAGGLYHWRDLPTDGITREGTPAAFDADGLLQPLCVVRGRGNIPTPDLRSTKTGTQYVSSQQVVELYFLDDADRGWDDIEAAANMAFAVLQDQQVTGAFSIFLVNSIDDLRAVDEAPQGSCMLRRDYEVIGRITT